MKPNIKKRSPKVQMETAFNYSDLCPYSANFIDGSITALSYSFNTVKLYLIN